MTRHELFAGRAKFLRFSGYEASHWSDIGDARASDPAIMAWARANGYLVFTNDLDFGALLAAAESDGPSVLQVRTQGVMPAALGNTALEAGALITVDTRRSRVPNSPDPKARLR